ncbi:hypothetical protein A6J33_009185 [Pantoea sp. FDAARGOS_194]|nr:hypothetical protein A6J33_009185 [Pantoea sp. FDAARGOS_194]
MSHPGTAELPGDRTSHRLRAKFSLGVCFDFYLTNASIHVACSSIKYACVDFFVFERHCQIFSFGAKPEFHFQ